MSKYTYNTKYFSKTHVLKFNKHSETLNYYEKYKTSPFKLSRKIEKMERIANKIYLKYPKYSKDQTISSS